MRKIILIALLLLSSQLQAAEPPSWLVSVLKVDNPNELAVAVFLSPNCPITTDELKKLVGGVLFRRRVKPLLGMEWAKNSLYLNVDITCTEPDTSGGSQIFGLKVYFGNYSVAPPVLYDRSYGTIGRGPKDYIVSSIIESAEAAVTDFIKANDAHIRIRLSPLQSWRPVLLR